jgi:hypothetical protein
MFKFLKSLFGGDKQLNQDAGIQIEQVPYKVEPPVVEDKVAVVNAQPIETVVPAADPAKTKPARTAKSRAPAKPKAAKPKAAKPAAKKPAKRKPKTTT